MIEPLKPRPSKSLKVTLTCIDCGEDREVCKSPKGHDPVRCIGCSRKRAAAIWNGRKKLDDP